MLVSARRARHELIEVDSISGLALRDMPAKALDYPWHQHEEIELTLIVQGSGVRYVGDSVEEFEAGDLCLIGSRTPHCWLSPPDHPGPVRSIVVQFREDVLGGSFLSLPAAKPLVGLFARARTGLAFRGAVQERAKSCLQALFTAPGPFDRIVRLLDLLSLLATSDGAVSLCLGDAGALTSPNDVAAASKVLAFVSAHSKERLTLPQVARAVGMSRASLVRFFQRYFGKTFLAHLTEVRVSGACRLLFETDMTASEVAWSSGFHSLSSFNRAFRRRKQLSPTEYRAKARAAEPWSFRR